MPRAVLAFVLLHPRQKASTTLGIVREYKEVVLALYENTFFNSFNLDIHRIWNNAKSSVGFRTSAMFKTSTTLGFIWDNNTCIVQPTIIKYSSCITCIVHPIMYIIHSLLPCLRLLAPEMNFTLKAPPMGIKCNDSYNNLQHACSTYIYIRIRYIYIR